MDEQDLDETARLILMEPLMGLMEFSNQMRENHPGVPVLTISQLWAKYVGIDRIRPTHDIATGRRL